jgi:hypothetical protein
MTEREPAALEIYQLRAVLRGISPMIWRRLQVHNDSTIADLHAVLQIAFAWEDAHLHRFSIRGRDYGLGRDGGIDFATDARRVRLCDLKLRRLERFVYEYDFGDSWVHDVRLEAVLPFDPRPTYPQCVAGKGAAPPEDCGGPQAFMAKRWQFAAIGRGESREDLEDLIDDVEDDEWETLARYHPDRFDRRRVNRALASISPASPRRSAP